MTSPLPRGCSTTELQRHTGNGRLSYSSGLRCTYCPDSKCVRVCVTYSFGLAVLRRFNAQRRLVDIKVINRNQEYLVQLGAKYPEKFDLINVSATRHTISMRVRTATVKPDRTATDAPGLHLDSAEFTVDLHHQVVASVLTKRQRDSVSRSDQRADHRDFRDVADVLCIAFHARTLYVVALPYGWHSGAGGGNRTRAVCLEGRSTTTMQRPRFHCFRGFAPQATTSAGCLALSVALSTDCQSKAPANKASRLDTADRFASIRA